MIRTARKKSKVKYLIFLIFPIVLGIIFFVDVNFSTKKVKLTSPLVLGESTQEKITAKLVTLGINISNFTEEKDKINIENDEGLLIIFNRNKDINLQLTSLQFIIDKNKMEGRQAKKIDLSFENPIVTF